MFKVLIVSLIFLLSSCEPASVKKDDLTEKTSAQLIQDINAQTMGACTQNSDCFSAGSGSKSCGGPESYIVFSKLDSIPNIFTLLDAYNQKRKAENAGKLGTCEYMLPPSVTCVKNKCKKQESTSTAESQLLNIYTGIVSISAGTSSEPITFKATGSSTAQYVKVNNLDLEMRSRLENYRNSGAIKQLKVKVFARSYQASACDFGFTNCALTVSALDVRAVILL